jgi:hypothetical protein
VYGTLRLASSWSLTIDPEKRQIQHEQEKGASCEQAANSGVTVYRHTFEEE